MNTELKNKIVIYVPMYLAVNKTIMMISMLPIMIIMIIRHGNVVIVDNKFGVKFMSLLVFCYEIHIGYRIALYRSLLANNKR